MKFLLLSALHWGQNYYEDAFQFLTATTLHSIPTFSTCTDQKSSEIPKILSLISSILTTILTRKVTFLESRLSAFSDQETDSTVLTLIVTVKGRLSYHLCVECFSQLSFDSEVYTKSAAKDDMMNSL